jgi:hypothetical protein
MLAFDGRFLARWLAHSALSLLSNRAGRNRADLCNRLKIRVHTYVQVLGRRDYRQCLSPTPDDDEKTLEQILEQSRHLRDTATRIAKEAEVLAHNVADAMKRLEERKKRFNELTRSKRKPLTD